jgi:hypothetical protein
MQELPYDLWERIVREYGAPLWILVAIGMPEESVQDEAARRLQVFFRSILKQHRWRCIEGERVRIYRRGLWRTGTIRVLRVNYEDNGALWAVELPSTLSTCALLLFLESIPRFCIRHAMSDP